MQFKAKPCGEVQFSFPIQLSFFFPGVKASIFLFTRFSMYLLIQPQTCELSINLLSGGQVFCQYYIPRQSVSWSCVWTYSHSWCTQLSPCDCLSLPSWEIPFTFCVFSHFLQPVSSSFLVCFSFLFRTEGLRRPRDTITSLNNQRRLCSFFLGAAE